MILLDVAIKILVNPNMCQLYYDNAGNFWKLYVTNGTKIYGDNFATLNTHSLVHLSHDVRKNGSLDNLSEVHFETKPAIIGQRLAT